MSFTILIRRGPKSELPAIAAQGELLETTDTGELFVGTGDGIRSLSLAGPQGPAGPAGADGATGPQGPAGIPLKAQITISAAQLLALVGSPVQLLPAPSDPTKRYVLFKVHARYLPGSAIFGNTSAPGWFLSWGPNVIFNLGAPGINPTATGLNLGALVGRDGEASGIPTAPFNSSLAVGQPLNFFSSGSNLTLGDGSLVLTIWYDLI